MKIVIPGGSGQVGHILSRHFQRFGHDVVVLSRNPGRALWRTVAWDAQTLGPWTAEIDGADVVINLAGRSVNCRYNAENRKQMMESRINSTRVVGQAIGRCVIPPRVWLQAGTATVYAHRYDAPNDEATGIIGGQERKAPSSWRYSVKLALAWEKTFAEAKVPLTRKVMMRSAMVMSPDPGGVFDVLLGLVKRGLGGQSGKGRQYVSWIHDRDFINAIDYLIDREDLEGPVNICSPYPVPNAEFMRELREAWGTRIGLPATKWMLEIGALFLKTETELVLKSRRVVPGRLKDAGFKFEYPTWPEAVRDLCQRWRAAHAGTNGHK